MTPSGTEVPPRGVLFSSVTVGRAPPSAGTRFRRVCVKNARDRLSGDQNGKPCSVRPVERASVEAVERPHPQVEAFPWYPLPRRQASCRLERSCRCCCRPAPPGWPPTRIVGWVHLEARGHGRSSRRVPAAPNHPAGAEGDGQRRDDRPGRNLPATEPGPRSTGERRGCDWSRAGRRRKRLQTEDQIARRLETLRGIPLQAMPQDVLE